MLNNFKSHKLFSPPFLGAGSCTGLTKVGVLERLSPYLGGGKLLQYLFVFSFWCDYILAFFLKVYQETEQQPTPNDLIFPQLPFQYPIF